MHAPPTLRTLLPAPSRRRGSALAAVAGLVLSLLAFVPQTPASAAPALLSQGRAVTSSSQENGGTPAASAVDGDNGTRWSSAFSDPQWIKVDLGSAASVSQIVLRWEAAYATGYRVEFSSDDSTWSTAYSTTTGPGGTETLDVSGTARYVRLTGTTRATAYGYSLWEFQVFGTAGGGVDPQIPGGGDLGPNVLVFDPSTPNIQGKVDEIFKRQESAQFGTGRYALMFKPGTYDNINAQIGFYTSIAGLGLKPDDTTFNGDVTVDAGWFNGNATQNFWRSAENLALNPVNGTDRWAVSQAAPFRRMHVRGGLNLAPDGYGWASGGYIADSKIDGQVSPYSQQQWYTRDSSVGGWGNGVWNMTFSGVEGAPAQSFPEPPYTTLDSTPVSREKPFLYLDGNDYKVFVPAKRTGARGVSWSGTPQGESVPLDRFYVVKPGATAQTINAAVRQGLHLLFTPGIYHVDEPIEINRAGTVALGLGLATIIPDNGVTAVKVGDVDGVRLAGLLIDAGTQNSQVLVEVGPEGASADHAADPTTVQDVFVRVGGAGAGKATTGMVVNSDDTVVDHTWLWRADHGDGVGWETNRSDYGLRVNGDDVLATGLFVEHFNKYDVQWYGERGKTVFFQNEKAYDAPDQAAVQNGDIKGYAAYKVGDAVTTHEGWGMGSYCYYNVNPTIRQQHGFQAPVRPGVRFHDLLVVSLGGQGQYEHVINNTGSPTSGTSTVPSQVVSFP
ncbi:discoidin domain-containing protein [Streptomyces griseus]|uniref:discoidin domain-containing protein n=1 Tax=Streptomyces griseus TaxID=1911 RepID=UPI00084013C0|nr:discoidin domain-containing protein [Streptomyces griseus]